MDHSARNDDAAVARLGATASTTIRPVTGYPRVKHCLQSPAEELLTLLFATKGGFAMVALAALLPAVYLLICFEKFIQTVSRQVLRTGKFVPSNRSAFRRPEATGGPTSSARLFAPSSRSDN